MFVFGLLLVGMHGSGGVVVGEARCELLVFLEAGITLGLTAGFCVSGGVLSLVVSLSGIGMQIGFGRLRLWLHVFVVDVLGPLLYAGYVVIFGAFCSRRVSIALQLSLELLGGS